jgi:E3 ubiquitin-protein ligase HERC2
MAEVSPMRILKLFSWQQLEVLVAGSPLFDFELWKQKTEASGLTSKTLDLFWKVMASFSSKEQSGFIRFAWGRSRLPPPKDFTTKMKLIFGQGKLPVAHTCFFSIELPEYATEAEMRTGLLTAINFGVGGILMG